MNYQHQHAARCESGTIANLLRHHGAAVSEPLAFGIAAGLSFAYLPFVRINGLPLIAYRSLPRSILRGTGQAFGTRLRFETFRTPEAGQRRLDELLAQGKVVGAQTSVFWLPYFPETMRFHFNAHNLLVYGKEGDDLAIALLPEPELVLLDEPTVGVDPQSRAFLLDAVKSLAQAGTTVLYTSHYIEEIEAIADDVAILNHGQVLRAAPLSELLAEGGAQMSLRLAAPAEATLALLAGFGEARLLADGEIQLALAPAATPAAVLQALETAGLPLQAARYGSHDLERLFMQLTHRTLRDE
ncbi:MAG: hypothetical protein CGU28_03420 [Candidatus Dactylopiibacterium carminicum]|nr:MAG: hypothetical protein CGU28_03420 [Candidatus Dactylopiibacterium carminicum]